MRAGIAFYWLGDQIIKADLKDLNRTDVAAPTSAPIEHPNPASRAWRTVRSFILWSHERGSIQYDVMVTLILLFVFFSPSIINFNDRPVERRATSTGVMVYPDGNGGLLYQVDAAAVQPGDDESIRSQLLRVIEPISGEISISRYESIPDKRGKVMAYKVWVERQ